MKNQYFGDVNDYCKYGLLRVLGGEGTLKIGLCWMLTRDDGSADGGLTSYLDEPSRWRCYDPTLFDWLRNTLISAKLRRVALIEKANLLPSTEFHAELLSDDYSERTAYFDKMLDLFKNVELIFFDPDNGLEVKSYAVGRRGSSKYLYLAEVARCFGNGCSLLIYQHFGRQKRQEFIERTVARISECTNVHEMFSFRTARTVYFLVPHLSLREHFRREAGRVAQIWGKQFYVQEHQST